MSPDGIPSVLIAVQVRASCGVALILNSVSAPFLTRLESTTLILNSSVPRSSSTAPPSPSSSDAETPTTDCPPKEILPLHPCCFKAFKKDCCLAVRGPSATSVLGVVAGRDTLALSTGRSLDVQSAWNPNGVLCIPLTHEACILAAE